MANFLDQLKGMTRLLAFHRRNNARSGCLIYLYGDELLPCQMEIILFNQMEMAMGAEDHDLFLCPLHVCV